MSLKTKPISPYARSMLATLQTDPLYIKHFYDEQNEYIVVTMRRWAGYNANPYALESWWRDLHTGGYLIRYGFDRCGGSQS